MSASIPRSYAHRGAPCLWARTNQFQRERFSVVHGCRVAALTEQICCLGTLKGMVEGTGKRKEPGFLNLLQGHSSKEV